MKQFAAIVALGAFASARRLRSEQGQAKSEQAYGQFVSKYNKDVKSTGQYKDKLAIFERNEGVIKAKNEKADKSSDRKAVRLAMNWTGDLTAEEYEALQGLDVSKTTDRPKRLTKHNKRKLDD